ncbi:MAG: hypothetical protein ACK53Y_21145, partial [bacterium]
MQSQSKQKTCRVKSPFTPARVTVPPYFSLCGAVVSIYCSRSRGLRLGLRRRLLRRGVWVVPSQAVSTVCFT